MAYDPQKHHRRPAPSEEGPAPVDSLIADSTTDPKSVTDDPPVAPTVTPAAADPPPDAFVLNTGVAAALGAVAAVLLARLLWRRRGARGSGQ